MAGQQSAQDPYIRAFAEAIAKLKQRDSGTPPPPSEEERRAIILNGGKGDDRIDPYHSFRNTRKL